MRFKIISAIISLLILGTGVATAEWMPLRNDCSADQPEFTLLEHSAASDRFEMRLPGLELLTETLDGKVWDRVEIPHGGYYLETGKPEVPHITRMLVIPARAGVHVEATILEEKVINGYELMPSQGRDPSESDERFWDEPTYARDAFYPETLALSGAPAIMRGVRLATIQINPVRYNPVTRELRVAHRVQLNVTYSGTDLRNALQRPTRALSGSWAKMMRSSVLNLDDALDVDETMTGSYLVICENDAELVSTLETKLLDWKRRKGHSVVLHTFAPGVGAYDLKAVIQDAYDTWATPPEFVLLVGDDNGTYPLPGWSSYVGDYPYSLLEGDDLLPELSIGRIPAESHTEAVTMFHKVLWYEKHVYVNPDDWIEQGLLVAGSSSSGLSTILTNRWIKTRMLENGFTRIDTMWYTMGGSIVTAIANGLNNGVSIFNYRGYSGMSGWTNSNTDDLINGFKMPFVTTLTCGTGGFSGESRMEHFAVVGTPLQGQGAVACVGTATLGTNTRCNNSVDIGMYQGLFNEGLTQAGHVLVRGKIELFNAYWNVNQTFVSNFSHWNNLAGDPGLDLFSGPLHYLDVEVADQMNLGENQVQVYVSEDGVPLQDATVCAYKADEVQEVTLTGEDGWASLIVNPVTAGDLKVTVTKHNYKPVLDSLDLVQSEVALGYLNCFIDDDTNGESNGDDDGTINPGETVEIPLIIHNFGSSITATNVTLTVSTDNPLVHLGDAFETCYDIPAGGSAPSQDDIDFSVDMNAGDGDAIVFDMAIDAAQGSWTSTFELAIAAPVLSARSPLPLSGGSVILPGETADISIAGMNEGGDDAEEVSALLRSLDPLITVSDSLGYYEVIEAGTSIWNETDYFTIVTDQAVPPGWRAALQVTFEQSNGIVTVDTCYIAIGERNETDPYGPDDYGYYCYDNTDLNYPPHPEYDWIEIDPDFGGVGTELLLYDGGEDQDAALNLPLPIHFQYYGLDVDTITVCTNGWISAVPNVSLPYFRNWPIPSALGPDGMIAPFWDDLTTNNSGRIYVWHDEENDRIVIEWSRMPTQGYTSTPETFELVLYDADTYPTPTGDSEILFQYYDVTEVSGNYYDNAYSTIGIESPDQTEGIQVVYSLNYVNPTIAPLANGRAYFFTTRYEYNYPGSDLQVILEPLNPPITIPAGGGSFDFNIGIENSGENPYIVDIWCDVVLPSGSLYSPAFGPFNSSIAANTTVERERTQDVPGNAPAGQYRYVASIGTYPDVVIDSLGFDFTKTGVDATGPVSAWQNYGEPWLEELSALETALPEHFELQGPYPNPFNPAATFNFALPEAGKVTLSVYDIGGRLVERVIDGWRDAGHHQAVFTADGLASGLYLYRFETDGQIRSGKLILLK